MSRSVLSATKVLRNVLMSDATVASMVRTVEGESVIFKIFPLQAPADTVGDFILYCRSGYEIDDANKMMAVREKSIVTLNVVSERYDSGLEVIEAIRSALIEHKTDPTLRLRITDAKEDITGWPDGAVTKYVQILTVEITDI